MRILLTFLFFVIGNLLGGVTSASPLHVVVDPGHGGSDSGAVRNGVREADIALSVSKKLHRLLENDRRFRVSLTRQKNKSIGLKERALFAHEKKGQLFISIHANASRDRRANGVEFYLQNHLEPSDEANFLAAREEEAETEEVHQQMLSSGNFDTDSNEVLTILDDLVRSQRIIKSDKLASALVTSWKSVGRIKKTAVRQAPFFLVSNVTMPSVLVEIGYISNRRETKKLLSKSHQQKIARSIFQGILRYKETLDKTH